MKDRGASPYAYSTCVCCRTSATNAFTFLKIRENLPNIEHVRRSALARRALRSSSASRSGWNQILLGVRSGGRCWERDVKFAFCWAPFELFCKAMCAQRVLVFSARDAKACGSESSIMRVMYVTKAHFLLALWAYRDGKKTKVAINSNFL